MRGAVLIGILGDFNPDYRSHQATNAALQHAATKLGVEVESRWLPTPSLLDSAGEEAMGKCDALFASPGSPYQSFSGMLHGIESARRRDWPFVGT